MIRAVVLDMDGTVLAHNSWCELHRACGLTDIEDRMMLRWYSEGLIDYVQWTKLIERIYIARRRATRAAVEAAFGGCVLEAGAEELVRDVRQRGLALCLLSGGVSELVTRVASQLGIGDYAANHHIVYSEDGVFERFELQGDDAEFKERELLRFCASRGIQPEECVCIGDGGNDRKIFAITGRGILYSPPGRAAPPELSYWKRIGSLREVAQLLDKEAAG